MAAKKENQGEDKDYVVKARSSDGAPHFFEIVEPRNRIKEKVGSGSGFDVRAVQKAEEAVRELAKDYINDLIYSVRELKEAFETFVSSEGQKRVLSLKKVSWHAHEIKGQGGSFGYPFVSRVAKSLCKYMYALEERNSYDDLAKEIMRAHVSTLIVIADKRMRGDGGETGQLVAEGLEVATQKHLARDPKFLESDVINYLSKLYEYMEDTEE